MGLEHVKATFEKYGRTDPMYAVLTDHARRGGRWDPDEFFAHGREEIDRVMTFLADLDLAPQGSAALDFGCGVGRLSQALARHFEHVTGVDISSTMVGAANEHNKFGERVQYIMNDVPNLQRFQDDQFDFVYSNITLQHMPPDTALSYVRDFHRVVRPGGLMVFQVLVGQFTLEPGSLQAWWYRLRHEQWRRLWQRARGRIPYEMHRIPKAELDQLIEAHGGEAVNVTDLRPQQDGVSLRYAVRCT